MPYCPRCHHLQRTGEVATLKKVIYNLKYKLYWKDRNAKKLYEALLWANTHHPDLKCDCRLCVMCGFWDGDYTVSADLKQCTFRPWLTDRIAECGLTVLAPEVDPKPTKKIWRTYASEEEKVFKLDCHLVIPDNYYAMISFGQKLFDARLGSGELRKLDRLFDVLKPVSRPGR